MTDFNRLDAARWQWLSKHMFLDTDTNNFILEGAVDVPNKHPTQILEDYVDAHLPLSVILQN